jgi:ubiquinone/menaquinone biosynthesis C-methylase UbiE
MSSQAHERPDHPCPAACKKHATEKHHHKGKSSESLMDKKAILRALEILPGHTVLDAGCGDGYMAKAFSQAVGETGSVYALDPDEISIAQLASETAGTNIQAFVGDITTTTRLASASIDLVYLSTVFHGFSREQVPGFQREIARILKPQGRLAIVEIHKRDTPFGPPMELRFSPEELRDVIDLAPLELVHVGNYFYMQIFEKSG